VENYKPVDIGAFKKTVILPEKPPKPTKSNGNFYQELKNQVLLSTFVWDEFKNAEFKNGHVNPCPVCGHNECFHVYNSDKKWFCFSNEHNSGGSVIDLVLEYKNFQNVEEAAVWLAEKFNIEVPTNFRKKKKVPPFNPLVESRESFLKTNECF